MGSGIKISTINQIKEYAEEKAYDKALTLIRQQDLSQSYNSQFIRICGEVFLYTKNYEECRKTLVMAHRIAPEGNRIIYDLIQLYIETGELELAEKYYEQYVFNATEHDTELPWLNYMMARGRHASGQELYEALEPLYTQDRPDDVAYEFLRIFQCMNDASRFEEEYHYIFDNFRDSEYKKKATALKEAENAREELYIYPEISVLKHDDSVDAEETLILEQDYFRMNPKEPEIVLMADDFAAQDDQTITWKIWSQRRREKAEMKAAARAEKKAAKHAKKEAEALEEGSANTESSDAENAVTEEALAEEVVTKEPETEKPETEETMIEGAETEEIETEEPETEETMIEDAETKEAETKEAETEDAETEEPETEEAETEDAETKEPETEDAETEEPETEDAETEEPEIVDATMEEAEAEAPVADELEVEAVADEEAVVIHAFVTEETRSPDFSSDMIEIRLNEEPETTLYETFDKIEFNKIENEVIENEEIEELPDKHQQAFDEYDELLKKEEARLAEQFEREERLLREAESLLASVQSGVDDWNAQKVNNLFEAFDMEQKVIVSEKPEKKETEYFANKVEELQSDTAVQLPEKSTESDQDMKEPETPKTDNEVHKPQMEFRTHTKSMLALDARKKDILQQLKERR